MTTISAEELGRRLVKLIERHRTPVSGYDYEAIAEDFIARGKALGPDPKDFVHFNGEDQYCSPDLKDFEL